MLDYRRVGIPILSRFISKKDDYDYISMSKWYSRRNLGDYLR